jgi:hypothetical protein
VENILEKHVKLFGDGKCNRGENRIWRTAKKERWKEVAKHK